MNLTFSLSNCPGYVPPQANHSLANVSPVSGLNWKQRGTTLSGKTLRSQCTVISKQGVRCNNSTTFDYRYCHRHLRDLFQLMVAPTSIPLLKGWGLYAVNPQYFEKLGLQADRRPVPAPDCVLFRKGELIGGTGCYFVGEYVTDEELEHRYPEPVCGDYVIGEQAQLIDGQIARTILQFSNDAINVADRWRRRNTPDNVCMPDWPVIQNADGIEFRSRIYLVALADIYHGQEIYWSYSGDGEEAEDYWTAPNHK